MKKNIGIIVPDLGGGGAEKVALLLSNYLSKNNKVSLLLFKRQGIYLEYVDERVIIEELDIDHKNILEIPSLLIHLRNFCKDKHTVFCGFQLFTEFFVLLSMIFNKKVNIIPVIQTSVSVILKKKGFFNKISRAILSIFYNRFKKIICSSDGVKKDLSKFFNVCEYKTTRIYNPVFFFHEKIIENINSIYERPIFITLARLSYEKRLDVMLKAWNLYKKDNNHGTLIILGEGPLKENLKEYCKDKNLEYSVIFKGFSKNIQSELTDSDIFLLTSDFEGFGNVLVEAMHYSLPVISTDCPYGPKEILKEGKYGILVPVDDPRSLSLEMKKLVNNQEKYNKYKKLSKIRSAMFDIERIMKKYEEIL